MDERNNADLVFSGDEDSAFQKLYEIVFYKMRGLRYRNYYITEDVIKTPYNVVARFLKTKYGLDEQEAKEIWDYLCQDFEVLNEFKYYVLNNKFVPDNFCVKRNNYSAKQIFKSTSLEAICAYNYLIFLKNNPNEALDKLKTGHLKMR